MANFVNPTEKCESTSTTDQINASLSAFFVKATDHLKLTFENLANPDTDEVDEDELTRRRKIAKEKYDHVLNQYVESVKKVKCNDCEVKSTLAALAEISLKTLRVAFSCVLDLTIPSVVPDSDNTQVSWITAKYTCEETPQSELEYIIENLDCELQRMINFIVANACGVECEQEEEPSCTSTSVTPCEEKTPCKKPMKKGYNVCVDLNKNNKKCGKCDCEDNTEKGLSPQYSAKKKDEHQESLNDDTLTVAQMHELFDKQFKDKPWWQEIKKQINEDANEQEEDAESYKNEKDDSYVVKSGIEDNTEQHSE